MASLNDLSYAPNYEVRVVDRLGNYSEILDDYLSLDYTMVVNDIGMLTLVLPGADSRSALVADARIEVWRSVGTGPLRLEGDTQWFITKTTQEVDDAGNGTYKITAQSANVILKRRLVAYYANSGFDYGAAAADDLMKTIVSQNFGSAASDTARNISTYLAIEANQTGAPVIYASYAWDNILSTLQEIANTSYQVGTAVYFDIIASSPPSGLSFVTFITQRGVDHRSSSNNPLVVGYDFGSVGSYTLDDDYTEEATYIYAGGPGEDDLQLVSTLEDTARSGRSIFGRKEAWIDANQATTALQLAGAASAALIAMRPRKTFQGKLLNVPGALYGVHWTWGDFITAQANNESFDCRVVAVHVMAQPGAQESIEAVLRSDT